MQIGRTCVWPIENVAPVSTFDGTTCAITRCMDNYQHGDVWISVY